MLLKLVISGFLLTFFVWRTPLHEIWRHLRHLDLASLTAAILLSLAAWCLSGARLWCLLPQFRIGELIRVNFASMFYGTVLPGQIAGDVVKAYRLGQQSIQVGRAEAATLVDRVIALFAMFLIGSVAAYFVPAIPIALRLFFAAGSLTIILCCTVAASRPFRHLVLEKLMSSNAGRIRGFIRQFGIAMHDFLHRPLHVLGVFVLAMFFHVMCIAINQLLGQALHISLAWAAWATIYAGVSLLVLLPISLAGIGLRESGYVGMLSLFGTTTAGALSLSFTQFALVLLGAAIGGLLELGGIARARKRSRTVRESTALNQRDR